MLNLPSTLSTPGLRADLTRQIDGMAAYMSSLAGQCVARSGSILPYLGQQAFDDTYNVIGGRLTHYSLRYSLCCQRH